MAEEDKVTIEAKSSDDAWYPCSLKFKGKHVHVHFVDYDSDEDETWDLNEFQSREDVLSRVRVTSEQLQDEECTKVPVGTRICALKELKDEQKYFDAVILKIAEQEHAKTGNGEEECKCKFTVRWEGGPTKGDEGDLDCSAITTLCVRRPEDHPELKTLLEKVAFKGSARKRKTPTRKRRSGNFGATNSASKKGKADTSVRLDAVQAAVKDEPDILATEDKIVGETAITQMTERDICSTINEVCDACQPNNSDADAIHPLKERDEGNKDQEGGELVTAAEQGLPNSLSMILHVLPKTNDVGITQSPGPEGAEAYRGETLGDKSSFDLNICGGTSSRGTTGQQTLAEMISSAVPLDSRVQGPGEESGLSCHASPVTAALPEPEGAAPAQAVVLISDYEDDEESHTQRSPEPNASNLKAARVFPERQVVQTSDVGGNLSEEMEQGMSDMKKICTGLWPINCILRIDNVEKDLCPQNARTFVSAMMQDVISVFLFPAGENETSTFGFVIFKDSQAAETALQLLMTKCIVASFSQRPWSVSRAKSSNNERELIAFCARGSQQAPLKAIESSASTGGESAQVQLKWVLPEMKEYKLHTELLELHSAHKKQLQVLWGTFNKEEADKKSQPPY